MSDEIPEGAIVMCVLASTEAHFADDAFSDCADCGVRLRHRPYIPASAIKLCWDCTEKRVAGEEKPKVTLLDKTVEELKLFYSRGRKQ